jgi:hypothetical protein
MCGDDHHGSVWVDFHDAAEKLSPSRPSVAPRSEIEVEGSRQDSPS